MLIFFGHIGSLLHACFELVVEKIPQSGIVQALYATPACACVFFNIFHFGVICKIYFFLEGGPR